MCSTCDAMHAFCNLFLFCYGNHYYSVICMKLACVSMQHGCPVKSSIELRDIV